MNLVRHGISIIFESLPARARQTLIVPPNQTPNVYSEDVLLPCLLRKFGTVEARGMNWT